MAAPRSPEKHQLNFAVTEAVHAKLTVFAKVAGVPVTTYAKMLFEAAYAARHQPTGDAALDASVSRVLLLHRRGLSPAEISELVNLPQGLVSLTVDAWRSEIVKGGQAA